MYNKKICLLVLSCDKYSDLWPIFFDLFEKNWSDCPFDKYLLTNFKKAPSPDFNTINIGKDRSWSDNLLFAIDKILGKYAYIFLFMDDGFITRVNTKQIVKDIKTFIDLKGDYMTFINEPKPTKPINQYFGEIEISSKYRATATWALWDITTLSSLLKKGESAWGFEIFGSERSIKYSNFYSVYKDRFSYVHGVIKGMWLPSSVKKLESLGYNVDLGERKKMDLKTYLKFRLYVILRKIVIFLLPQRITTYISNKKWSKKK
jgi:hypothetical protein